LPKVAILHNVHLSALPKEVRLFGGANGDLVAAGQDWDCQRAAVADRGTDAIDPEGRDALDGRESAPQDEVRPGNA